MYNETDWFQFVPANYTPGVATYFNDFLIPSSYTASDYDTVITGVGSIQYAQDPTGVLQLTTGPTAGNFTAAFLKDQYYVTNPGQAMWWSSRIKLSTETNITFLLGYSDGSTNNTISFKTGSSSLQLFGRCSKSTAITDLYLTTLDLSAAYVTMSFMCDGNQVKFFVNGAYMGYISTNIPDPGTKLRSSYQVTTLSNSAVTLDIDYIYAAQQRTAGGG